MAEPQETDDVHGAVRRILQRLHLPEEFFDTLMQGDDWSFVIKVNALLESALTLLLANLFRQPDVQAVLAEVEFSQKIKMVSALNVFEAHERKMMSAIGNLRNKLVHNVGRVQFTFADYLADRNAAASFVENFGQVWRDPVEIAGRRITRAEIARENPKLTIWFGVLYIIGEVFLALEFNQLEQTRQAVGLRFASLLVDDRHLQDLVAEGGPGAEIAESFGRLRATAPLGTAPDPPPQ